MLAKRRPAWDAEQYRLRPHVGGCENRVKAFCPRDSCCHAASQLKPSFDFFAEVNFVRQCMLYTHDDQKASMVCMHRIPSVQLVLSSA